jgi:Subtilase family
MRSRKRCIVMATVPAALIMTAIPAGVAVAATQSSPSAGGAAHQYIVILHNQNGGIRAQSAARRTAVSNEQKPVLSQLHSVGGREVGSTSLVNAIVVNATASQAQTLAGNSAVAEVVPNQVIPGPSAPTLQGPVGPAAPTATALAAAGLCGTPTNPQANPEALFPIHAVQANLSGADGAGVTVAVIADGLDPANPDFQRNAAYASAGSPAGSPVVTQVDFSGDPAGVPTPGGEIFLDASSVAAQGNTAYDLSQYIASNDPRPVPANCDIKITGDAPGANVLALKVFSENNDTTTSNFLQAINYAVENGAKVINESFGSNNFPDLALDVTRQADDAAVAAGVTVVASSGDSGFTSTIGSPATDPNVISVGASTTFRAFEQGNFGGADVPGANGQWVDNNIAAISSSGNSEAGNTVDLVAPGDWNWALCSPDVTLFTDCKAFNGTPSGIQFTGGTSESSPLVAGGAADVIQAYAAAHGGTDPTPALVKQILMSSATDIDAPGDLQGAGLLNIAAAVRLARSIQAPKLDGGLLLGTNQVNIQQQPGATTSQALSVTNTSSHPVIVNLSTRALTDQVASHSGTFCMQPGTPTATCPANTGTITIWSGATEVYQAVHFTVPHTAQPSRLDFSSDYQYSGQTSLLHVALLEPDGTYAAYSDPQGLADFGDEQVANPPAGTWTAVFFTVQDSGTADVGTSGPIQWNATTSQFAPAGHISPSTLFLGAGATGSATLSVTSPAAAGDTNQSVVVSSGFSQTTIPVTVRTTVPTTASGGTFQGVLTGGNGRPGPAAANFYTFTVPKGAKNIHAEIDLANDPNDVLTGYLIDPSGQNLGYSSNVTEDAGGNPESTQSVDLYHAQPAPGQWTIALQWANPVSGLELQEPFTGTIGFGKLPISSNLPTGASLTNGTAHTYQVTIHNSGQAPEDYFVDPRLNSTVTLALPNQNSGPDGVDAASMTLPLPGTNAVGGPPFPYYLVPTETSQISESLTGSVPVDFDSSYFPGDPDLEGIQSGNSASLTYSNAEISPGLWDLNPSEIGPYPASGAPAATASATFSAVTKAFDATVSSSTGDLWSAFEGLTSTLAPVYIPAGGSATISVTITPSGASGSTDAGTLYVDDLTIAGFNGIFGDPNGDEVAAIPYSYTIK